MHRDILLVPLMGALLLSTAQAGEEPAPRRFALAVYHFNVQYVAGGLEAFWEDVGRPATWEGLDRTDEGVQDAIIVESFLPLLELYAAHPDWGADFELQGLMVDVIRERHPDTLLLMQQLSAAGNVSFDSFHYSDELWTAQPAQAIHQSFADTQRAFDEADVVHGTSFFTQEGQFATGMGSVVPEGSVAMIARNLFGLHYPDDQRQPLFDMGDGRYATVAGHSWTTTVDEQVFQTSWTFMDDGELLATGDLNPYFLPSFVHDPEEVADYEQRVQDLVDDGYEPVSVATMTAALLEAGYAPPPLPPLIDGAWQPDDTANVGLWMGDGGAWEETEADGAVRAGYAKAYRDVRIAALVAPSDPSVAEAWRALELGGVSDSTGWNPYRSEVAYALEHQARATDLVWAELAALELTAAALGCQTDLAVIDGADATVRCADPPDVRRVATGPVLDAVAAATEALVVDGWFTDPEYDAPVWTVSFTGLQGADVPDRSVEIPWTQDTVRFLSAGQADTWTEVPLSVFADADRAVGVPLSGGVLDLGGDLFCVLDPTTTMLAARVHPDSPVVRFHDDTPGLADEETWEFYFVTGEAAALALADRLVQRPDRWFVPPVPIPPGDEVDCTCESSIVGGSSAPVALLLVLGVRRRRVSR